MYKYVYIWHKGKTIYDEKQQCCSNTYRAMIGKQLFKEALVALKGQYDKDVARSKRLSDIYGADIDPVDNSLLTNVIFKILDFNGNKEAVEEFCYEQNFGRNTGTSIDDLWESLVKDIEVEYEVVKPCDCAECKCEKL